MTSIPQCSEFIPGGGSGGRWCHRCRLSASAHATRRVEIYHPATPWMPVRPLVVPVTEAFVQALESDPRLPRAFNPIVTIEGDSGL